MNKKSIGLNLILLPFLTLLMKMVGPMHNREWYLLVGMLAAGCSLFTSK